MAHARTSSVSSYSSRAYWRPQKMSGNRMSFQMSRKCWNLSPSSSSKSATTLVTRTRTSLSTPAEKGCDSENTEEEAGAASDNSMTSASAAAAAAAEDDDGGTSDIIALDQFSCC